MAKANKQKKDKLRKLLLRGRGEKAQMARFRIMSELARRCEDGTATEKERQLWDSWDMTTDKNLFTVEDNLALTPEEEEIMSSGTYKRIAEDCGFSETNWSMAKEAIEGTLESERMKVIPDQRRVKNLRLIRFYGSVAAVFALLMTIGVSLYLYESRIIRASDEIVSQQLQDSTVVKLNQDSRLTIATDFGEEYRRVKMVGEIFFDVAKNPNVPFRIEHGMLLTQVKGTSFTICDYPEMKTSTVTVRTGKVTVKIPKSQLPEVLEPGMQLIYNKIDSTCRVVHDVNWEDASGWMNGNIVLTNADAEELALRLKQSYHYSVAIRQGTFNDRMRFNTRFTASEDIQTVMKRLQMVYGIKYSIKDKEVTIFQ